MSTRTQRILAWFTTPAGLIAAAMIAVALFAIGSSLRAEAADKGGPPQFLDNIAPKPAPFSGCGPSVRAGWAIGAVDFSPVTFASEGGVAGVGAFCDWTPSKYFLVGVFATYDWAFHDLHTIGVRNDLSLGARIGVPVKNWMFYVGGAWSQVEVEGLSNIDGYKMLGGLEVRLATTAPVFLAIEGSRGFYDDVAGFGMDINSTAVTAALKWKIGGK